MVLEKGEVRVITTRESELEELESLYCEACGYFKFDEHRPMLSPAACFRGADLPAGGKRENYELLSIYISSVLVGYVAVYRDFPAKTSVQIMFVYISEPARRCGFGSVVCEELCRYFYEAGYMSMRALISLRNWGGLRFFFAHGFDRVLCVETDGELKDGGNGSIGLERRLIYGSGENYSAGR